MWAGGPSSVSVRGSGSGLQEEHSENGLNTPSRLPGSPWAGGSTALPLVMMSPSLFCPCTSDRLSRWLVLVLWNVATGLTNASLCPYTEPTECYCLGHGHMLVEICATVFVGTSLIINPCRLRGARPAQGHLQEIQSLLPHGCKLLS